MREWMVRKIDEMRQKPEYVRVWYAWVGVLIAMFFVVIIWIFTLQENLRQSMPADDVKRIREKIPAAESSEEVKSLDEIFSGQGITEEKKTEGR